MLYRHLVIKKNHEVCMASLVLRLLLRGACFLIVFLPQVIHKKILRVRSYTTDINRCGYFIY